MQNECKDKKFLTQRGKKETSTIEKIQNTILKL